MRSGLEENSGLMCGRDFGVGYSPELINLGDRSHRFENIVKVVSADSARTLQAVSDVYGSVVNAGSIRHPLQVVHTSKFS